MHVSKRLARIWIDFRHPTCHCVIVFCTVRVLTLMRRRFLNTSPILKSHVYVIQNVPVSFQNLPIGDRRRLSRGAATDEVWVFASLNQSVHLSYMLMCTRIK